MRRVAPLLLAVLLSAPCCSRAAERAAQTRAGSQPASPAVSGPTGLSALMAAPVAAAAMPQGWSGYLSGAAAASVGSGADALAPAVVWTLEGGAQGRVVD